MSKRSDKAPLLWCRKISTEPLPQELQNAAWPVGRTFQAGVLAANLIQLVGKHSSRLLACGLCFLGKLLMLQLCLVQGRLY